MDKEDIIWGDKTTGSRVVNSRDLKSELFKVEEVHIGGGGNTTYLNILSSVIGGDDSAFNCNNIVATE